jgi:hypothetical protein
MRWCFKSAVDFFARSALLPLQKNQQQIQSSTELEVRIRRFYAAYPRLFWLIEGYLIL